MILCNGLLDLAAKVSFSFLSAKSLGISDEKISLQPLLAVKSTSLQPNYELFR